MTALTQKEAGAYYTPHAVTKSLLRWALRSANDRLLDPSCGDGRFIAGHEKSVGIEQDEAASHNAMARAPWALVHQGDFFSWAAKTPERFECAAGNPPFIRYQSFSGAARARAQSLCESVGAKFSGLTSSWAPFIVATATLLKPGGRMAFVVPAEIGHAPYSAPVLNFLASNFSVVHVIAVREKLFPDLSEDCWLLYADGFGSRTEEIRFSALSSFTPLATPPRQFARVNVNEWRTTWRCRLRPFLLPESVRELYRGTLEEGGTKRFGELASIGIGYVTGANDFFHLRPSAANRMRIPKHLLQPTVRKGSALPASRLTRSTVSQWWDDDEQMLLLRLPKAGHVPAAVARYLDSHAGHEAREAYKCRVREPWYSVPDVQVPDFFLSYMSGLTPNLVRNEADCTCTNSVHCVRLKHRGVASTLLKLWDSDFVRLSCEMEGHPLGGGMLKLEPREATAVAIPSLDTVSRLDASAIGGALSTLREWRHYARRSEAIGEAYSNCLWLNELEALHHFGLHPGATQSGSHIKPLHWYIACRLVLEGGFDPEDITPRPPFVAVHKKRGAPLLHFDPSVATGKEMTILGGLKTKDVDVVVTKKGIGPVLAVSCKGMQKAFRNLTNRMEETIGECTNLHITYPAMVFGYMFVLRANRTLGLVVEAVLDEIDDGDERDEEEEEESRKRKGGKDAKPRIGPIALKANDMAFQAGGTPAESIVRFYSALREITGRRGIRNDVSRYESVALAMIESEGESIGSVVADFPPVDSPLRIEQFFATMYHRYEERFVIGAPSLKAVTKRNLWSPKSPAFDSTKLDFATYPELDYPLHLAD